MGFYFPVLLGKVEGGPWWQKMAVWFLGPGWFPGLPRMGDNNLCPEIPQREKHFTNLPLLAHLYLAVQVLHDGLFRCGCLLCSPRRPVSTLPKHVPGRRADYNGSNSEQPDHGLSPLRPQSPGAAS